MMKVLRIDVFDAIEGERDYQDDGQGNAKRHEGAAPMTVGEHILCMEKLLADARAIWYRPNGGEPCLHEIRKITALGVQCMERYGAPQRKGYER